MIKLYTDELKYNGENNNFTYKFAIFNNICIRMKLFFKTKCIAFFIMLKGSAQNYYYSNINIDDFVFEIFDEICYVIKSYFEKTEYKRNIIIK